MPWTKHINDTSARHVRSGVPTIQEMLANLLADCPASCRRCLRSVRRFEQSSDVVADLIN
jgi:hypothetical protein